MSTDNQDVTDNAKSFEVTVGWMVPAFATMQIKAASQREAEAIAKQMLANNSIDIMSLDWQAGYEHGVESPIVIESK
jgi:hypothetical protein